MAVEHPKLCVVECAACTSTSENIPMTDGFSGVESALDLSQSKAGLVTHSDSYGFRVLTPLCGKGDALYVLKTHLSWV